MSVAKSSQELNMECGMSTVKRTLVAVFIVLVVVTVSVLLGWNPLSAFSGVERDRYDRARGGGGVVEEAAKEEEAPAEEVREEPREEREVVEARLERSAGSSAYPEEWSNSIGMKFRLIPAGEFWMGAVPGDGEADSDENPRHRVEITKPFYMGVYEVTQEQWQRVMVTTVRQQRDKANFKSRTLRGEGSSYPVYYVSWEEAVAFCEELSRREGENYRLPTEAEWEYACRAGTNTRYFGGDSDSILYEYANYADRSCGTDASYPWIDYSHNDGFAETSPVCSFKPNTRGLYDMSGNVWEWCEYWYAKDYFSSSPSKDPQGPSEGDYSKDDSFSVTVKTPSGIDPNGPRHVLKGGSWDSAALSLRSSNRLRPIIGNLTNNTYGFRIIRDAE